MKNLHRILLVAMLISACGQIQSPPTLTPASEPRPRVTPPPQPTPKPRPTVIPPLQPTKAPAMLPIINRTTHGHIRADETWEGEIHIVGDIIVEEGVTLTIRPGTIVYVAARQDSENLFDDPLDLKTGIKQEDNVDQGVHLGEPYRDEGHHISILVRGRLNAVGTPEQMITITSDSDTPTIYDWNRLRIMEGRISYALIEYYRILALGDKAEITHSELRHIGECGVCANSSGLVTDNYIWDAGHELIDMHNSSPTIRNNRFGPYPGRFAIVIDNGSPVITGNVFEHCGGAVLLISPSTPVFENNEFIGTPVDIQTEYP